MDLIQVLKALADENRIRILNILNMGELCVCEIESILELNQSNVSRHLNKLSTLKIIRSFKKAQFVYYTLNKDMLEQHPFISDILNNELIKVKECLKDIERLKYLKENHISCEDIISGKGKLSLS